MSRPPPPSPRQVRDAAEAALAAGNPIESVAQVFDVPIESLQEWVRQRPDDVPGAPRREPERPWLRFPGTAVFPTGLAGDGLGFVPAALFIALPVVVWMAARWMPRRWDVLAGLVAFTIVCAYAAVQSIRSMRTERFEMRLHEIARYDLRGCMVLPYDEIIGLTAGIPGRNAVWSINFLTSTGKSLTIHPQFEQLEDERLWVWLKSIPQRGGRTLFRMSDVPDSTR